MRTFTRFFTFLLLCSLAQLGFAQSAAPATSPGAPAATPTVTPTPSPTPISLPAIADQAQSTVALLQQFQTNLDADVSAASFRQSLAELTREIDVQLTEQGKLSPAQLSMQSIDHDRSALTDLNDKLATLNRDLGRRATDLNSSLSRISQLDQIWQPTARDARLAKAPPELLQRVETVLTELSQLRQKVEAARGDILREQSRVLEQSDRVAPALAALQQSSAEVTRRLLRRDDPPVWRGEFVSGSKWSQENQISFAGSLKAFQNFVRDRPGAFLTHGFLIAFLIFLLHWLKRKVQSWVVQKPDLQQAIPVLEDPVAAAIALSFLCLPLIYQQAPYPVFVILSAIGLLPTVLVLRHLLTPGLFTLLNAFVVFYFVDHLRNLLTGGHPLLGRTVLLGELTAGVLLLGWFAQSRLLPLLLSDVSMSRTFWRNLRTGLRMLAIGLFTALLANVFGYVNLSSFLTTSLQGSVYVAFLFYAIVRILEGLGLIAFETYPLNSLRAVQRNRSMLQRRIKRMAEVAVFIWWLLTTLRIFGLRPFVLQGIQRGLDATLAVGTINISLGRILAFAAAIVIAFLVSSFIRFILEEDVYSHLRLPHGMSYAISTLLHYTLIVLGLFFALGALGFDLTKFTILAGAFSVGVGFGLQNVINNFVSGIILLFERPINVGDVIQVDSAVGEVTRIGIRASIIKTNEGSEVIVPNGTLISSQVINWTFSGRQRLVVIQVSVARTSDPQQVNKLLVAAAETHSAIVAQPPPQAFVTGLTATSMNFALQAWTDRYENWFQVRSDLSVAVSQTLARAEIVLV
jgi:potassium-dependent mechanosensitive channel